MKKFWKLFGKSFRTTGKVARTAGGCILDTAIRCLWIIIIAYTTSITARMLGAGQWLCALIAIVAIVFTLLAAISEKGLWTIGFLAAIDTGKQLVPQAIQNKFPKMRWDDFTLVRSYVRLLFGTAFGLAFVILCYSFLPLWVAPGLVIVQTLAIVLSVFSRGVIRVSSMLIVLLVGAYFASFWGEGAANEAIQALGESAESWISDHTYTLQFFSGVRYGEVVDDTTAYYDCSIIDKNTGETKCKGRDIPSGTVVRYLTRFNRDRILFDGSWLHHFQLPREGKAFEFPGGSKVYIDPLKIQRMTPGEVMSQIAKQREERLAAKSSPPRPSQTDQATPVADITPLSTGCTALSGPPEYVALVDKYLPQFRMELQRNLVLALITVESSWNPRKVSPDGAQGLMQLMPGTARDLGVANPFDPEQNIRGGIQYLAQQLQDFSGTELALGAYNAGPKFVLDRPGKSWGEISSKAPGETQNYVPKIIALARCQSPTAATMAAVPTTNSGLVRFTRTNKKAYPVELCLLEGGGRITVKAIQPGWGWWQDSYPNQSWVVWDPRSQREIETIRGSDGPSTKDIL